MAIRFVTVATFLLGALSGAAADPVGPLPPGKPAGVRPAAINEAPYLVGAAALATALGLLLFDTTSNNASAPTGTSS
ncbi:MAG TPA: hypothetical protein VGC16_04245 [Rhizomicrobium sp.]